MEFVSMNKNFRGLWDEYKDWIISRINFNYDAQNYDPLLYILHNKRFDWVIDNDENRAQDGLALREEFLYEIGIDGTFGRPDVTILEILAALAIRMDDEYTGDPNDPNPGIIFFDFLDSLDLSKFRGKLNKTKEDLIETILDDWMYRRNDTYIFDVNNPKKLRNLEIWSQMQYYLNEKYS